MLFFIQIFATLGFAVLYSTLVLYATEHLHFPAKEASAIMGVFGAFNYGLHLFGGYLGGRFLCNRNLFVGGMVLQVLGCGCIAAARSLALLGPGALPHRQRAQRHVHQHDAHAALHARRRAPRERVPLELRRHEHRLLHRLLGGRSLSADRELFPASSSSRPSETSSRSCSPSSTGRCSPIGTRRCSRSRPAQVPARFAVGIAILVGLVPVVWFMLQHPVRTETLVKAICASSRSRSSS